MRRKWIAILVAVQLAIAAGLIAFYIEYEYVDPLDCCEGEYTVWLGQTKLFSENDTFVFGISSPMGASQGKVSSVTIDNSPCTSSSWAPVAGDANTNESCTPLVQIVAGQNYNFQVSLSYSNGVFSNGVFISGIVIAH